MGNDKGFSHGVNEWLGEMTGKGADYAVSSVISGSLRRSGFSSLPSEKAK